MAFSWNPSWRQAVVFHSSRLESDLSNPPKKQDSFDFFVSKKNSSVSVAKMLHLERYQNSTHEASEGLNPCREQLRWHWNETGTLCKRFSSVNSISCCATVLSQMIFVAIMRTLGLFPPEQGEVGGLWFFMHKKHLNKDPISHSGSFMRLCRLLSTILMCIRSIFQAQRAWTSP